MRKLLSSATSVSCVSATLLALAGASGCDSTTTVAVDATYPDAAIVFPDGGNVPDPCEAPTVVNGTLGTPSVVSFDTTTTTTAARDLGLACGNASAYEWAAQEVIEYHVPGTGPVGVSVTTVSDDTADDFNTVLQIRSACRTVPTVPFSCFDDAGSEIHATGGVQANGGDVVYVYVTGYSQPDAASGQVDEGAVTVTITAAPNTPPTVTGGALRLINTDSRIEAQGTDPEGNVAGALLGLYTASGRLDLNGDGVGDSNDYIDFPFTSIDGTTTFDAQSFISSANYTIAAYCRSVGCTQASLIAYDTGFALSDQVLVDVVEADIVGLGDACDADTLCASGLTCSSGTCAASAAATAACTAATVIEVPTPTDSVTTASASSTLSTSGTGVFTAPTGCADGATSGREKVFAVHVPAGTFDLTFSTQNAGTASTVDTVLYARQVCADPDSALACEDDINTSGGVYSSAVTLANVTEGDYFAFVESYNSSGGAFELSATLLPVRASGDSCDPAGTANRCATGTTCSSTTMVCE